MATKRKPAGKKPKKDSSPKRSSEHLRVFNTALLFIRPVLVIAIVWILFVHNKGYERLYKYNIKRTYSDISKYKGLDYEERLEKMLPQDFPFLAQVRDATPENAVILVPPKEVWHPPGKKLGFGAFIWTKAYLTYFLYPRRILVDDEKDAKSPLMADVTHVVIVDSWGYDKLQYEVSDRPEYAVMPVKKN